MIICSFSDPQYYSMTVDGKTYKFDWSDRFGPLLIGKKGQVLESKIPNRFLVAVSLWQRQGKRVDAEGLCVWDDLPFRKAYELNKSNLLSEELYLRLRKEGKITELPFVMVQDKL